MRPLKLLAASTMLLVCTAACANGDPERTGNSPDAPASSPTTPGGASTAPVTPPAWHAKYSKKEIAAFEDAVARLAAYEREAEPIWAEGKYTREAAELFRRYFTTAPRQIQLLRDAERGQVQIRGVTTVLWSKPRRLQVTKAGASTTFEQCVDESTSKLFQRGERVIEARVPQLRDVVMTGLRQDGGSVRWYIASIVNGGGERPCADGGEQL